MANEIMVKGTQEFMGIEIPIIEGGFGERCKCVTANTVAEIHETRLDKVNELISNNINEFEIGVDILDLMDNEKSLNLAKGLGFITNNRQKHCYLLSEQGYMLLVGFMKTEKAKQIRKELRRQYFAMRNVINSNEQLKAQLLLQIYDGGQDAVVASRELVEMETAPLKNTIAQQTQLITEYEPKVTYYDEVLKSNSAMTITSIAKDYGMSGQQLNKILHDEKVQYKMGGTWLLYQNHARNGYTKSETICLSNGSTTLNTKWTQKGRLFIYELLKNKCGILPLIERE